MDGDWNELPSVVLVQVYSLLPTADKLNAASVCKNWREPVFQVPFSPTLNLNLEYFDSDGPRIEFLTQHFAHKVANVTLIFNPSNPSNLDIVENLFAQLETNRQLRSLQIRCSEESLTSDLFNGVSTSALIRRSHFSRKVLQPLMRVLKSRNCLETFSFPLVNDLAHSESNFYSTLERTSKLYSIRNLYLATLQAFGSNGVNVNRKEARNAFSQQLMTVNTFVNLQVLSVNHDALNDDILAILGTKNNFGGLDRLILVATRANKNVSNAGWVNFKHNNPRCGVSLAVVGDGVTLDSGSNIIFQAQKLTHFRALYCKEIRMTTLNSLISWNEKSLQYIELVHENYDWMDYIAHPNDEEQFLDPIIYAAWRCQNLTTLKIGFLYCGQSLVGIARLKGPGLTNLEISRNRVIYHNIQQLSQEVSKALGRPWKPVEDLNERRKKPNLFRKFSHGLRAVVDDEIQD